MKKNTLYKNLELLKTELFDSPDEVKGAFNVLVSYFDADYTSDVLKRQIAQITKESQKIYEQIQNSKSETEKESLKKKLDELEKKANKLEEDLKKRKAHLKKYVEAHYPPHYKDFDVPEAFKACEKGFSTLKAEEIMQRIADNPYGSHKLISECPNLSRKFLERLSLHKDPSVRGAVALNPNTPKEIIVKLSKDQDWRVSNPAKSKLDQGK